MYLRLRPGLQAGPLGGRRVAWQPAVPVAGANDNEDSNNSDTTSSNNNSSATTAAAATITTTTTTATTHNHNHDTHNGDSPTAGCARGRIARRDHHDMS